MSTGNRNRLVLNPTRSAITPDIETPIPPAPMAIPRKRPETSPICVGMSSWAIAIVTAKDDKRKNPKAMIAHTWINEGKAVFRVIVVKMLTTGKGKEAHSRLL